MIAREAKVSDVPAYAVEFEGGPRRVNGDEPRAFTLAFRGEAQHRWFLEANLYAAAMAFVRGEFDVRGDLAAAVRLKRAQTHRSWKDALAAALARLLPPRDAENIRFHYDRSNDFYRAFLDSSMQYSEGCYEEPAWSLEQAQQAKLDRLCRKLDLRSGERFLDIGCGWGGLVMFAARKYEVEAVGCTLSRRQHEYAVDEAARRGLSRRVEFLERDYHDLQGAYGKIASVGMYEHVGCARLPEYFRAVASRLADHGLFLNSGIARPENVRDDAGTRFLRRRVFPGGELPRLSSVLRAAELAGLEVIDLDNVRLHYARTCRDWVTRLERNAETCLRHVDMETHRTWRLYLAASAVSFEDGDTACYWLLMRKR